MAVGARLRPVLLVILSALSVLGSAVLVHQHFFAPRTITAYFASATGIYPGDQVRIAGVPTGTVESIEPVGTQARMVLAVDRDVPVPADAQAVVVASSLVSARYVQLTPAYASATGGPLLADGAVIGVERTAVPVEWDEVKEQLTRLATDLGPSSDVSTTSVARFLDSAATAMEGNGARLRETLAQLSGVGRILAAGSGDIVETVKNLQIFVTALRDSNIAIVQFQDRLAAVSSLVDANRADLDAAVTHLSEALGEVQRFVAGTRDQTAEQVQRLAAVTQTVVDNQIALKNILHVAPTAFANAYNMYNPDTGSAIGTLVGGFANPLQFICAAIGAVENATASETAKLCAQYLGPALRLANFNYLPFPINAYLAKSPSPHNLVYSDPALAPGAAPPALQPPPAVSAYTGAAGNPAGPATVEDVLLPAELTPPVQGGTP